MRYGKPKKKKKKNQGNKHKYECRKYKRKFFNEHGYLFCESKYCHDPNRAFPPHSTHHIMSAGKYPAHDELHNPLNLILLCFKCHTEFEEYKREDEHNELVRDRGLNDLFIPLP